MLKNKFIYITNELINKRYPINTQIPNGWRRGRKPLTEEHRKNVSKSLKDKPKSEEHRKKLSENHADFSGENHWNFGKVGYWKNKKNPDQSEKMKQRTGEKNPNYGKDPWNKGKKCPESSGPNHWNWQGGISLEPYCIEFVKDFKEEIKERDNYQCQNPECRENSKKLCVHHINYIKKDCDWRNLITICISCNARANYNRDYWQELYTSIIYIRD